jgi:hypothetical protein
MIVPGGGISLDGQRWVSCRPGFFLPVRVLSRLFRRLFLEKLMAAHAAGRLSFFGEAAHLADAQSFGLPGPSGAHQSQWSRDAAHSAHSRRHLGRSGLPDSDDLAHSGTLPLADLAVECRGGSAVLIGGVLEARSTDERLMTLRTSQLRSAAEKSAAEEPSVDHLFAPAPRRIAAQDPEYTYTAGQKIAGFRTTLGVPLLRGQKASRHFQP